MIAFSPAKLGTTLGRIAAIALLLGAAACSNMDEQQQKMVSGGAIGAVVGTVGTVITGGCIPCGTAIGGAVGVAGGYLIDQLDKSTRTSSPQPAPAYYNQSSAPVQPAVQNYGPGS